jgi:hypothetical protein
MYAPPNLAASYDKEAVDLAASSDKSGVSSEVDAKYEATMISLSHPLCDWQFKKCYLLHSHQCAVSSKMVAAILHTQSALFYGSGHIDRMSVTWSLLVAFAESITWTMTKTSREIRPMMGLNAPGHGLPKRKTMSEPSLTCLSLLQLDSGLRPTAKRVPCQ